MFTRPNNVRQKNENPTLDITTLRDPNNGTVSHSLLLENDSSKAGHPAKIDWSLCHSFKHQERYLLCQKSDGAVHLLNVEADFHPLSATLRSITIPSAELFGQTNLHEPI